MNNMTKSKVFEILPSTKKLSFLTELKLRKSEFSWIDII